MESDNIVCCSVGPFYRAPTNKSWRAAAAMISRAPRTRVQRTYTYVCVRARVTCTNTYKRMQRVRLDFVSLSESCWRRVIIDSDARVDWQRCESRVVRRPDDCAAADKREPWIPRRDDPWSIAAWRRVSSRRMESRGGGEMKKPGKSSVWCEDARSDGKRVVLCVFSARARRRTRCASPDEQRCTRAKIPAHGTVSSTLKELEYDGFRPLPPKIN